ncbi:uncharacterized protein VDAG_04357 [Verticillium dahliae VdLs.17]|uniref:Uncharacterized protein n=1 Tax=Verticillium dahliae (strain VdLs.17 / ATCC MYA-4575 / FGSC 10137) TaxID=498257 RepID=G2X233_VERDV|nr:uncharacterized protein VDAG_04357 [Verticillium dahliae VdLs.17]EGY22919.1 hypothetical protein VDAG_04357 [Verticillium dahliae VdLs.17]
MAHTESFLIPAPQLKSIGDVLLSHNEKVDSTGDAYGARCLVTMQPPSASRKMPQLLEDGQNWVYILSRLCSMQGELLDDGTRYHKIRREGQGISIKFRCILVRELLLMELSPYRKWAEEDGLEELGFAKARR